MFRDWTFGKRLAVAFGLAGLTLVLVIFVAYRSTAALIANNEWVEHTHEVRRSLTELRSALKDAETGQRGYIITGKDSYLEPYTQALEDIGTLFARAR